MKSKKKGSSKCSYYSKGFHFEKSCFKKKMGIMTQLLERHNIDVPDFAKKKEPKKPIDPQVHCHNAHSKGDECYDFSARIKSFSHMSNSDTHSDISKS